MRNAAALVSDAADYLQRWAPTTQEERWALVEWAEALEAEAERGLRDSVAAEVLKVVLDVVANAPAQHFLPEDVPSVVALLKSTAHERAAALRRFRKYWESVDFRAREAEVQRFWFRNPDA